MSDGDAASRAVLSLCGIGAFIASFVATLWWDKFENVVRWALTRKRWGDDDTKRG